ncbi:magnesium chelatase subunit H [Chloroflexus sp.]|uniref:magnesium chelatase subunit H n=1 Tax=Chloroflexus sp. TaxID=1904827 RepID=UPI00298F0FD1|nr:magnesium chelatase subunit H [Chloroflexus sp.]MCS6887652.1 magnesium chelatase subunit H [Chloroflexus sp.]MDW8403307.1 magnesium chelatase subunit H [Chloroflexus sp.]
MLQTARRRVMRFVFMCIEANNAPALRKAAATIEREHGLRLAIDFFTPPDMRTAADWERLAAAVARADFVFGSMLFGEEYVRPLSEILAAAPCPVCMIMSSPSLIKQTRIGKFDLRPKPAAEQSAFRQWLSQFQPKHGHGEIQRQMSLVRGLSKMLKFLPGKARDIHTYVMAHQFWAASTPENLRRLLLMLIERYVPGYKGKLPVLDPQDIPEMGAFHPDAPEPFADLAAYRAWRRKQRQKLAAGTVGLLTMRPFALSGNSAHLDALIRALEARGIEARAAYSPTLDMRPTVERFFTDAARARRHEPPADVDLIVNTTGFALVGGPASTDPAQASAMLDQLDTPMLDLFPLVFQHIEQWRSDDRGIAPFQLALNVSLPELDGATDPLVIGGMPRGREDVIPLPAEIELAADRIASRLALRRTPPAERRIAITLFNFPPNLGNAGTAAYLDVFASVFRLMQELRAAGYTVELPPSADDLRRLVVEGNALLHGTDGNVADSLPVEEYRRLFPDYVDIEPYWGPAPGQLLSDGKRLHILGRRFGNVFVGLQPSFGYERDPIRLLMSKDAAPHHGFAAYYVWLRKVFKAHAVLHFGTHGALEFMPGKQAGLSAQCWPLRLLGGLPNFYYYCVNNPSEGSIARRRGMATLISYLVPPVQQAGLYKGLRALKDSIDRYRAHPDPALIDDLRAQAEALNIAASGEGDEYVAALGHELLQVEQRMIPVGLHVLGQPPQASEQVDVLSLIATFTRVPRGHNQPPLEPLPHIVGRALGLDYVALTGRLRHDPAAQAQYRQIEEICRAAVTALVEQGAGRAADEALARYVKMPAGQLTPLWDYLLDIQRRMTTEREISSLLRALNGGYVLPSAGNDVVRNPSVVPTGRNIHAFDPFHVPSPAAAAAGMAVANELLERVRAEQGAYPETVAMVLWGTDNIKTEGEGIAQALALVGARAVADELGRITTVELIPLAELGRPRIDVVLTVSGIFRDLFAAQAALLDRAIRMAATADEPLTQNFVRAHALAQAAELGLSVEAAATRVFSNASGSYGANVNHLVESSTWEEDGQLAEAFITRKSFAFQPGGEWSEARAVMEKALATVSVTFQNVDSVENGISDIDHYYEYLGGLTKSVEKTRGARPTALMGEVAELVTPGASRVRSLEQMVRIESRAKLLNPKWYEGMLKHGYEGVHEIEIRVSNTYGWSATAQAVEGWVYQGVAETYLLDPEMRERLASLNPHATAGIAGRLLEAHNRGFWQADEATLEQLREIYADLEDRLEGVR